VSRTAKRIPHPIRRRIHKDRGPSPYTSRSCPQHKLACSTERIAKNHAAIAFKNDGLELRAYKCPYCHLWHLTSQVEKEEES
jgi:hypothetical protein